VLSPEIEDRNAVEVGNWAKHKKNFYKMNEDLLSIIILNLAFDEMLKETEGGVWWVGRKFGAWRLQTTW
jgi:hypothetical protein